MCREMKATLITESGKGRKMMLLGYFIMIIHYGGSPHFLPQLEKIGEGFSGHKWRSISNLQKEPGTIMLWSYGCISPYQELLHSVIAIKCYI